MFVKEMEIRRTFRSSGYDEYLQRMPRLRKANPFVILALFASFSCQSPHSVIDHTKANAASFSTFPAELTPLSPSRELNEGIP